MAHFEPLLSVLTRNAAPSLVQYNLASAPKHLRAIVWARAHLVAVYKVFARGCLPASAIGQCLLSYQYSRGCRFHTDRAGGGSSICEPQAFGQHCSSVHKRNLLTGSMDRQAGQRLSRFKTSGIRRTILILLAFSYLFVGVAHFFSCTDQAAAAASGATAFSDIARTFSDFPDEEGGKKTTQTAGHCHVCAPALIPADVQDVRHASRSAKLEVVSPELQFENHQRLDTPPPKHLT